jgi:hypothetical protein
VATAIALTVSEAATVIDPEYTGELVVGVDPSVVKWIVAEGVVVLMVTVCAEL